MINRDAYELADTFSENSVAEKLERAIDRLAHTACFPIRASSEVESIEVDFIRGFVRPLGPDDNPANQNCLVTDVTIELTTYDPTDGSGEPDGLRQEFFVSMDSFDEVGDIGTNEYILEQYEDGSYVFQVRLATDGLAEALRHDDRSFSRAFGWRYGSVYEAEAMLREVRDLQAVAVSDENSGEMVL